MLNGLWKRSLKRKKVVCQSLVIIFPISYREICDFLTRHVIEKFRVNCTSVKYSLFDSEATNKIYVRLREASVLIVGYDGELSPENYYKIGMAHALEKPVILINLNPVADNSNSSQNIPDCVQNHPSIIFMDFIEETLIQSLEEIVPVLLNGDIDSALYLKALELCKAFESDQDFTFEKLNKFEFISKLQDESRIKNNQGLNNLFSLYLGETSKIDLLYLIAKDKMKVIEALNSSRESNKILNLNTCQTINNNYISGDQIIHQHGQNDNIGGDLIQGDQLT